MIDPTTTGWEQIDSSNRPEIYGAKIKTVDLGNKSLIENVLGINIPDNVPILVDTNVSNGSYTVFFGNRERAIYTQSASGARSVQNQSIYTELQNQGEVKKIDDIIRPRAFALNQELGTPSQRKDVAESSFYKTLVNTAPPGSPSTNNGGSNNPTNPSSSKETTDQNEIDQNLENALNNPEVPGAEGAFLRTNFGSYKYPIEIDKNGQDYVKFDIVKYGVRKRGPFLSLTEREGLTDVKGTIFLPIQPSISDNNQVTWNEESVNPLLLTAQTAGTSLLENPTQEEVGRILNEAETKVSDKGLTKGLSQIIKTTFINMATQSQNNLLSRLSGAILNPNMELLFQGPTLRPFNFTFRLTPRSEREAVQVRSIIRAFKEASAVQQGIANLFLKSPYVFKIRYILGGSNGKNHPSINRIKVCALQAMTVDYTPAGTYMTYNDETATMTSYVMSLQFKELTPIYASNYKDIEESHIGF